MIRSHAEELETLLNLMRFANIEHLGVEKAAERSIVKVKQNLRLWLSEKDARSHMEKLIYTAIRRVKIDWRPYMPLQMAW